MVVEEAEEEVLAAAAVDGGTAAGESEVVAAALARWNAGMREENKAVVDTDRHGSSTAGRLVYVERDEHSSVME